jgi:hypothetical protein
MSQPYVVDTSEMINVANKIKNGAQQMKDILDGVDKTEVSKIRDMKGGNLLTSLVTSWDELKTQVDKVVLESSEKSSQLVTRTATDTDIHFDKNISLES